jgi:hypothetical protein
MKTIIIDNFFDNFQNIENEFKNITLYNQNEYNQKLNLTDTWPGKRSEPLHKVNPFLFNLFLKEFDNKFDNFFKNKYFTVRTSIHLRLNDDDEKDWIHTDKEYQYTLLVYLSETNLSSGTLIYDQNKNVITDIKFVKNRALLFDARYLHKSSKNFGNDIKTGRLTFNAFFDKFND